jgi:hypothetical protein
MLNIKTQFILMFNIENFLTIHMLNIKTQFIF